MSVELVTGYFGVDDGGKPKRHVSSSEDGARQAGRIMCPNVLCCPAQREAIAQALRTALTPEFAAQAKRTDSPYNGGDTSGRIVAVLEKALFCPELTAPKGFYDGN